MIESFLDFLYPPECLHCGALLRDGSRKMCPSCLDQMEFITAKERCSRCFSETSGEGLLCSFCLRRESFIDGLAAPFDYLGPPASLVRHLKYGRRPELASAMAGYMTAQLVQLDWPPFDLIVPVPSTRLRIFDRGYNQSALLAKEIGKMVGLPVKELLKKASGSLRQAGLMRRQRRALGEEAFSLIRFEDLEEKTVLLIDDVATTGTTIERCAGSLGRAGAERIYALVFSRAIA